MVIPIGDQNIKGKGFPIFSYSIIAINVLVFFLIEYPKFQYPNQIELLFQRYGAQPSEILLGQDLISVITSMFLHGGLMHLLGNMLFMWIFADNIELTIGKWHFLGFYLLGGSVATFTHAIFEGSAATIPMVGASGAIAAVMGAYLTMYPSSRINMMIAFIFRYSIPAWVFLVFWGGTEIYTSIRGIALINEVGDSVAHAAHAGGFIYGVIAGFYFKKRYGLQRVF